jgi:hypothetical protein
LEVTEEREFTIAIGLPEQIDVFSHEHVTQDANRSEEELLTLLATLAGDPSLPIMRKASGRDNAVEMRVQHGKEANPSA